MPAIYIGLQDFSRRRPQPAARFWLLPLGNQDASTRQVACTAETAICASVEKIERNSVATLRRLVLSEKRSFQWRHRQLLPWAKKDRDPRFLPTPTPMPPTPSRLLPPPVEPRLHPFRTVARRDLPGVRRECRDLRIRRMEVALLHSHLQPQQQSRSENRDQSCSLHMSQRIYQCCSP